MNREPRRLGLHAASWVWLSLTAAGCGGNGNTNLITPIDSGSGHDSSGGGPDSGPVSDAGSHHDAMPPPGDAAHDTGSPKDTTVTCEAGLVDCGDSCVDTTTNPKNCGGCGVDCSGGTCSGSICQLFGGADAGCGPTPVVGDQACIGIDGKNVYWGTGLPAASGGAIYSVPITGGCPTLVVGKQANPHAVASNGTTLFWTDSDFTTNLGGIGTSDTSGGGAKMIVTAQPGHPYNIAIDATNVYFTQDDGSVWQVAQDGSGLTSLEPAGSSLSSAAGYVVSGGGNVYFTETGLGDVDGVPIGGGTVSMFATGQMGPRGIALDTSNIYWTDSVSGDVLALSLTGTTPTTLATGQAGASGMAVDAKNAYWSTQTSMGMIAKAPIGGGAVTTLASMQAVPGCVAVDATSIYWIDSGTKIISKTGK
jgi:sugar lactone lactonase YvrE